MLRLRLTLTILALILLSACSRSASDQNAADTPRTASTPAPAGAPPPSKADMQSGNTCGVLPNADALRDAMRQAARQGSIGGFAEGSAEWAALVDRDGLLCAIVAETDDPSAAWPGAQSIAKAKAFTANAFSSDTKPMSTARLYTLAQPGHSLYGANVADPFNPECMNAPHKAGGLHEFCGGVIAFGGGLALYRNGKRVGGLGLSGDTPCADHEMAKRVRAIAQLEPPPGPHGDDISYSSVDGPSIFMHPMCPNTYRDGKKLGEEPPAAGY